MTENIKLKPDSGTFFNRSQGLILKAALMEKKEASDAWEEWKKSYTLEDLDYGTYRLLPLLIHNLTKHNYLDEFTGKLKGIYKLAWYENQVLTKNTFPFLRAIQEQDIPLLVLKGLPLARLYYERPGLRPFSDADILVPADRAEQAARVLAGHGLIPEKPFPADPRHGSISCLHALHFQGGRRVEVDLHWHVLAECCYAEATDAFVDASVPIEIDGLSLGTLSSAGHLIHVCTHGTRYNPVSPVRWIPDAMVILRNRTERVDWDWLIKQSEEHSLSLAMRNTLSLLKTEFKADIPETVIDTLSGRAVPYDEKREYELKAKSLQPHILIIANTYRRRLYKQNFTRTGPGGFFSTMLEVLKETWGLDSTAKLILLLPAKVIIYVCRLLHEHLNSVYTRKSC